MNDFHEKSLTVLNVKEDMLPSKAYKTAIDSTVYRPSELMFGSLLASYILGFIGLISTRAGIIEPHSVVEYIILVLYVVQYTSISITFAYLTAGFYLSYHAGILTMHHMPLGNLKSDFLLALLQALSFGFSMLMPSLFPIMVGLNIILAHLRQTREHKRHVLYGFFSDLPTYQSSFLDQNRELSSEVSPSNATRRDKVAQAKEEKQKDKKKKKEKRKEDKTAFKNFRNKFVELVGAQSELSVWRPMKKRILWIAGLAIVLGISVTYFSFDKYSLMGPFCLNSTDCIPGDLVVITIVSLLVASSVIVKVRSILMERAKFLYNKEVASEVSMNRQFIQLLKEIKEYWLSVIVEKENKKGDKLPEPYKTGTDTEFNSFREELNKLWIELEKPEDKNKQISLKDLERLLDEKSEILSGRTEER